jgi:hypothetical protein
MERTLLPYINVFTDVRGKRRYYFRRRGFKKVPLPGLPGSEEFMAAYQAALAQRLDIGERLTKPGTIDALIVDYYRSEAFTKALAPASQQMRRNILERFRAVNGGNLVVRLQREHVVAQIKGRAPYAQKNWLKTLRGLMLFAVAENYRGDDPTSGVKAVKPAVRSKGHMTWDADQIAAYRNTHDLGSMARLATELLLNVAARRAATAVWLKCRSTSTMPRQM